MAMLCVFGRLALTQTRKKLLSSLIKYLGFVNGSLENPFLWRFVAYL
jgi:hypothetical protein